MVWSRAASQDDNFIKNHFSANINISAMTVLVIAVSTAVLFLLLMLFD